MPRTALAILASLQLACASIGELPSPRWGLCSTDSECEAIVNPCARAHDTWECEATVAALTSLIEPLLIVFLGVVVGGIVMAMFLPIFQLGIVAGGL